MSEPQSGESAQKYESAEQTYESGDADVRESQKFGTAVTDPEKETAGQRAEAQVAQKQTRLAQGMSTRSASLPGAGYDNVQHQVMYDWVQKVNAEQNGMVADAYTSVGNTLASHVDELRQGARASQHHWTGAAAEAARQHVGSMADWADHTGQGSALAGTQHAAQGHAAHTAKTNMPQPTGFDPKAELEKTMSESWNPFSFPSAVKEYGQKMEASVQGRREAARVMNDYHQSLQPASSQLPVYQPPNQLQPPTPPPGPGPVPGPGPGPGTVPPEPKPRDWKPPEPPPDTGPGPGPNPPGPGGHVPAHKPSKQPVVPPDSGKPDQQEKPPSEQIPAGTGTASGGFPGSAPGRGLGDGNSPGPEAGLAAGLGAPLIGGGVAGLGGSLGGGSFRTGGIGGAKSGVGAGAGGGTGSGGGTTGKLGAGAGPKSGAGSLAAQEQAAARAMSSGAAGRGGASGMMPPPAGANSKKGEDAEHRTKYMVEEEHDELFSLPKTAPPVIGERPPDES